MKTEHILDVMGGIDPALVEEIGLTGKKKRRLSAPLRAGLTAACVCLALLGSAFGANAIWGVRVAEFNNQGDNPGFDILLDTVEHIPVDSLPQEVLALPRREIMELNGVEEAEELLGIPLPGFAPFQGLKKTNMRFGRASADNVTDPDELTEEDYTYYDAHCFLEKYGHEADGSDPTIVSVSARYTSNVAEWPPQPWELNTTYSPLYQQVIHFDVSALIYTENGTFDTLGRWWMNGGDVQLEQRSFITPDGQEIPVFSETTPVKYPDGEQLPEGYPDEELLPREHTVVCAYFVQDGVLYEVWVSGWRSENGQAVQMTAEMLQAALEDVLTSFQLKNP